jgi:hypothetical protein
MGRAGKVAVGIAMAGVFGTLAVAPERVPFLLTHDKVSARIAQLDEKARPFAVKINLLVEGIERPVHYTYQTPEEQELKLAAIGRESGKKQAELNAVRREAEERVCNDTVLAGEGQKFELVFDYGTRTMPESVRTACGIESVTFEAFLPINHWRAIFALFAIGDIIGVVAALFRKEGKKGKEPVQES